MIIKAWHAFNQSAKENDKKLTKMEDICNVFSWLRYYLPHLSLQAVLEKASYFYIRIFPEIFGLQIQFRSLWKAEAGSNLAGITKLKFESLS